MRQLGLAESKSEALEWPVLGLVPRTVFRDRSISLDPQNMTTSEGRMEED